MTSPRYLIRFCDEEDVFGYLKDWMEGKEEEDDES